MKIIGFKVWTADEVCHRVTDWRDVPDDFLQVIVTYFDEQFAPGQHYRHTIDGCDWYWFDWGEEVVKGVRSTAFDAWEPKPETLPDVKRGTGLPDDRFLRICRMAAADKAF